MRLMIDTNLFLDVLLKREPFFAPSRAVLQLCEQRAAEGFLSASSVTDLFYLLRRSLRHLEATYDAIGFVLSIARVLTVTNEDVLNAYLQHADDFEDCLLETCAIANRCDAIITRNKKDFAGKEIVIMTPEELLSRLDS